MTFSNISSSENTVVIVISEHQRVLLSLTLCTVYSFLYQAIQHIEGTQGKVCVGGEEEQRRAVIVTPGRVLSDAAGSDTASNSDGADDCSLP